MNLDHISPTTLSISSIESVFFPNVPFTFTFVRVCVYLLLHLTKIGSMSRGRFCLSDIGHHYPNRLQTCDNLPDLAFKWWDYRRVQPTRLGFFKISHMPILQHCGKMELSSPTVLLVVQTTDMILSKLISDNSRSSTPVIAEGCQCFLERKAVFETGWPNSVWSWQGSWTSGPPPFPFPKYWVYRYSIPPLAYWPFLFFPLKKMIFLCVCAHTHVRGRGEGRGGEREIKNNPLELEL